MGVWYAHALSTTCILSKLPRGWPRKPEDAVYFPAEWLKGKGWPTFERTVSSQVKKVGTKTWRRIIDTSTIPEYA